MLAQVFSSILLLCTATCLHIYAKPYTQPYMNRLEGASLASSLTSQVHNKNAAQHSATATDLTFMPLHFCFAAQFGLLIYSQRPEFGTVVTVVVLAALGGTMAAILVQGCLVAYRARQVRKRLANSAKAARSSASAAPTSMTRFPRKPAGVTASPAALELMPLANGSAVSSAAGSAKAHPMSRKSRVRHQLRSHSPIAKA